MTTTTPRQTSSQKPANLQTPKHILTPNNPYLNLNLNLTPHAHAHTHVQNPESRRYSIPAFNSNQKRADKSQCKSNIMNTNVFESPISKQRNTSNSRKTSAGKRGISVSLIENTPSPKAKYFVKNALERTVQKLPNYSTLNMNSKESLVQGGIINTFPTKMVYETIRPVLNQTTQDINLKLNRLQTQNCVLRHQITRLFLLLNSQRNKRTQRTNGQIIVSKVDQIRTQELVSHKAQEKHSFQHKKMLNNEHRYENQNDQMIRLKRVIQKLEYQIALKCNIQDKCKQLQKKLEIEKRNVQKLNQKIQYLQKEKENMQVGISKLQKVIQQKQKNLESSIFDQSDILQNVSKYNQSGDQEQQQKITQKQITKS